MQNGKCEECQDYSRNGLQLGPQNYRGQAYRLCVDRIKWLKPKRFILENVPAFGTYDNGNLLRELQTSLQEVGYKVHSKVIDAIHFSVPQTRKRLFIVGIRLDLDPGGFRFPTGTGTTNLDTILDPPCAADNAFRLPNGMVAQGHVKNEQNRCENLGINWKLQPRLMNVERSEKWGSQSQPISPCLLSGLSRGVWLLSRGRRINGSETLRLQGVPTELYKWPRSENTQRRMAGNAICVTVLAEIVKK